MDYEIDLKYLYQSAKKNSEENKHTHLAYKLIKDLTLLIKIKNKKIASISDIKQLLKSRFILLYLEHFKTHQTKKTKSIQFQNYFNSSGKFFQKLSTQDLQSTILIANFLLHLQSCKYQKYQYLFKSANDE